MMMMMMMMMNISKLLQSGLKLVQNLGSGFVDWNCASSDNYYATVPQIFRYSGTEHSSNISNISTFKQHTVILMAFVSVF